ncbi:hypothetical protein [Brevibacillus laterosporus]|uniref:hypothetical protein n=1 Tax=Brevibacillus laterosporus TaxID=1465 RepID=UPI0014447121|nr:hypothetical protein [Brevibacillus laterosporus]NKQ18443.1 hypothetical protein [Brevibacillus laterosporus]WNX33211.1 hypothetical protein RWW94_10625 [Brevibacillus laterosporus]
MAFNAKTDWKYDEIVTEKDMNRVEKGIKEAHDAVASTDGKIGNLDGLNTTAKSNVVVAVNELFTNVSNGKNKIATALTDKGVPATGSETFDQLAAKISKAGIGDTDKKALIDIANRATDNDSTVRKAIITKLKAVSTEKPLGLTDQSTWADISAVIPNIKTGKGWASGTTTSASTSTSVPSGQAYLIKVTGINFKPNLVVVDFDAGETRYGIMRKVYRSSPDIDGFLYANDYSFNMGGWTITENGFSTGITEKNMTVKWYAYE